MQHMYGMSPDEYAEALRRERGEVLLLTERAIDNFSAMVDQPVAVQPEYYNYAHSMYQAAIKNLRELLPDRLRGLIDDRSWFYAQAAVVEYGITLFSNNIKRG